METRAAYPSHPTVWEGLALGLWQVECVWGTELDVFPIWGPERVSARPQEAQPAATGVAAAAPVLSQCWGTDGSSSHPQKPNIFPGDAANWLAGLLL